MDKDFGTSAPSVPKGECRPEDFQHDALVIRTCKKDGTSYGDFKYPLQVGGMVSAPDWVANKACGNGLHGLLDGLGDWGLVPIGEDRVWQVLGVKRSECVDLGGDKVKFPRARELYVGLMGGAMKMIQAASIDAIKAAAKGNTATGYRGHAAATGDSGHAAATGYSGHAAATGDRGHAAATGDSGHAAATGDSGHAAATGPHSCAVSLGIYGTAEGAIGTWLTLAYWEENKDYKWELKKVVTQQIDGKKLKPDTPYKLSKTGKFVRAA